MGEERPHVVVLADGAELRRTDVDGRLYVGRECVGAEPGRRLLLDDPHISRSHFEIRIDDQGEATLFDTSSNGTLLNGSRIDRAIAVPLRDGDELRLGDTLLRFHTPVKTPSGVRPLVTTMMSGAQVQMVLVAGDVVDYSTLSELATSEEIAGSVRMLFGELQAALREHRGALSHLAGDAFLGTWDVDHDPHGVDRAVDFALEAAAIVERIAPQLPLRHADGSPLRMGFGVAIGQVSFSQIAAARATVLGDPANVAFRLGMIAGRGDHSDVLVTAEVARRLNRPVPLGPEAPLSVKGRVTPVQVQAVKR